MHRCTQLDRQPPHQCGCTFDIKSALSSLSHRHACLHTSSHKQSLLSLTGKTPSMEMERIHLSSTIPTVRERRRPVPPSPVPSCQYDLVPADVSVSRTYVRRQRTSVRFNISGCQSASAASNAKLRPGWKQYWGLAVFLAFSILASFWPN